MSGLIELIFGSNGNVSANGFDLNTLEGNIELVASRAGLQESMRYAELYGIAVATAGLGMSFSGSGLVSSTAPVPIGGLMGFFSRVDGVDAALALQLTALTELKLAVDSGNSIAIEQLVAAGLNVAGVPPDIQDRVRAQIAKQFPDLDLDTLPEYVTVANTTFFHNGSAGDGYVPVAFNDGELGDNAIGDSFAYDYTLDLSEEYRNWRSATEYDEDDGTVIVSPRPQPRPERTNPVIIDLDGDGVEVAVGAEVYFDMDDDGYLEQTAWAAADDGFLVIDLNADGSRGAGDGVIDQTRELVFSLWGEDGDTDLQALATATDENAALIFDSNGDGILDSNDTVWSELRIWQDSNQNGVTDDGELMTLDELGFTQINLTYDPDADGNVADYSDTSDDITIFGSSLLGMASYVRLDENGDPEAITGGVGDVALSHNTQGWRRVETATGHQIEFEGGEALRFATLDSTASADVDLSAESFDGVTGDDRSNAITGAGLLRSVQMSGGDGDDSLTGGLGDDILSGDEGSDTLIGGAGNDLLFMDALDVVSGGDGYDTVIVTERDELDDDGNVTTTANSMTLDLEALGIEAVQGGDGDDAYSVSAGYHTAISVSAGAGDDTLTGGAQNDSLSGDDGNDSLVGNGGDDVLSGGNGDDIAEGGTGDDQLLGGAGGDTLQGGWGDDNLFGGSDDDSLSGDEGDDYLSGGDGDDTLDGGAADDLLTGSDGNDLLMGGEGDDTLSGGEGNDTLHGNDGEDLLRGGAGNDVIHLGLAGDTRAEGGEGDDRFYAEHHNQRQMIFGGIGHDTLVLSGVASDYTIVTEHVTVDNNLSGSDTWSSGGQSLTYYRISGPLGENLDVRLVDVEQIEFSDGTIQTLSESDIAHDHTEEFEFPEADYGSWQATNGVLSDMDASAYIGTDAYHGNYLSGDDTIFSVAVPAGGYDSATAASAAAQAADINLGAGDDAALMSAADDRVDGGVGNDYISGGDGADTLLGGSGSDTIFGGSGNDSLEGASGADFIDGGESDDTISGGSGGDRLVGGDGNDTINGGDGADLIQGGGDNDTLHGDGGQDQIYGEAGADLIYGGDGADLLIGGDDDDTVEGGNGNDQIFGGDGNDDLSGDAGHDQLDGGDGNDMMTGGAGSDVLIGGDGDDSLEGGAESDTLTGGSGADSLNGGTGLDTAAYANSTAGVSIDLGVGTASGGDATGDTLISIENLIGSMQNDALTGDASHNQITGGHGNDTINGGAGNDILIGDESRNRTGTMFFEYYDRSGATGDQFSALADIASTTRTSQGFAGTFDVTELDEALGGDGDHFALVFHGILVVEEGGTYSFELNSDDGADFWINGVQKINHDGLHSASTATGAFLLTAGTYQITTRYFEHSGDETLGLTISGPDTGDEALSVFESGMLGDPTDSIVAQSNMADVINGGDGHDRLEGGDGNDILNGDSGNDTLLGDDGQDTLDGGTGNDTLYGGAGNDNISGGDGNDELHGDGGFNVLDGGIGDDVIYAGGPDLHSTLLQNPIAEGAINGHAGHLVSGDFNGDGYDDLMFTWESSGQNRVFYSDGAGGFTLAADPIVTAAINGHDGAVIAGDFNGDGVDDVMFTWDASGQNRVFFGNTAGGFSAAYEEIAAGAVNGMAGAVTVGDFNGDGCADIMYSWADSGLNRTVFGQTDGTFSSIQEIVSAGAINGHDGEVLCGDFNGDGTDDLMFTWSGSGFNRLLLGQSDGSFVNEDNLIAQSAIAGHDGAALAGDFNGDGISDLLFTWSLSGETKFFLGNATGGFTQATSSIEMPAINSHTGHVVVADFNGDGFDDEIFTWSGSGQNRVFLSSLSADEFIGGSGWDRVIYSGESGDLMVDLETQSNNSGAAHGDTFTGIEEVEGGFGNDTLLGDSMANILVGSDGNDSLQGRGGDDTLIGGEGADTLEGGIGVDSLLGGTGNDTYLVSLDHTDLFSQNAFLQTDVIADADGEDHIDFSGMSVAIFVDATTGLVQMDTDNAENIFDGLQHRHQIAQISGVEHITGTGFHDHLIGEGSGNRLDGGAGHDSLEGNAGNDTLLGGEGNDTLVGGTGGDILEAGIGVDSLYGGSGDDTYLMSHSQYEMFNLNGYQQIDTIADSEGEDHIDFSAMGVAIYVNATTGIVQITSNNTHNIFDGARHQIAQISGIEHITGSDLIDHLIGESSANRLDGGAGNDSLEGNAGNDTLIGGAGNDTLNGGPGDDTFIFADGHGYDVIEDFDAANDDEQIDLSGIAAITSYADLPGHRMNQVGNDVVIDTATGQITLLNVSMSDLDQDDFVF